MKHRLGKAVRRNDLLRSELSNNRISSQDFAAGRMLEEVWTFGGQTHALWSERVDCSSDPSWAAASKQHRATQAVRVNAQVQGVVGPFGLKLLKTVLVDCNGFSDAATVRGETPTATAMLFRAILKAVAEHVDIRDEGT